MKNIKQLKENYLAVVAADLLILVIDGEQNTTLPDLYKNFATGLSFPDYFGNNLDGLYDMLCDLNWLEDKNVERVHVVLRNYDSILKSESEDERLGILSVLRDAAEEWHWLEKEEKHLDFEIMVEPSKQFKKDLKEI